MASLDGLTQAFADTSLFCRIEESLAWPGLIRCLDYFGQKLQIVPEVDREMAGLAKALFPGLTMMKSAPLSGEFLRHPPVPLDPADALRVGQIASSWPDADPAKARKNYGEVATILQAKRLRVSAFVDDYQGRKWAQSIGVQTFTTRDIAVELAFGTALTEDDAASLWQSVYRHDGERAKFDAALAARRS